MSVRPLLHKLRGVRIEGSVFIGDDAYLESEHPECIELHDGCIVGMRSTLVAHTRGCGKIIVEKDAMLGAACVVVASVGKELRIGAGSVVAAGSVVSTSLPPRTFCRGPKAEPVAVATVPLTVTTSYEAFVGGLRPLKKASESSPNPARP